MPRLPCVLADVDFESLVSDLALCFRNETYKEWIISAISKHVTDDPETVFSILIKLGFINKRTRSGVTMYRIYYDKERI